ncbi:MAG TPA: PQQ-binding-like beta-propeller repeat protein, partial [Myxococcaceae bacterium]|nr:PQQ-binding-like beta-propeller repeat protein [Myxococcaceae bacterium]
SHQVLLRPQEGTFSDWARAATFSPDGARVASAVNNRDDFAVRVNERVTGRQLATFSGPTLPIRDVALGVGGKVAAGSADGSIHVWDVDEKICLWRTPAGPMVNAVAFSSDGHRLASGDSRGAVTVYDTASGEVAFREERPNGWVRAITFSPNSRLMAAGFSDGTVTLYDMVTGASVDLPSRHAKGACALAFSYDGRLLAITGGDGAVRLWSVDELRPLAPVNLEAKAVQVAFAPGGERLAISAEDGAVHLYDRRSGREVQVRDFDGKPTALSQEYQLGSLAWTGQSHALSSISANGTVSEWSFG